MRNNIRVRTRVLSIHTIQLTVATLLQEWRQYEEWGVDSLDRIGSPNEHRSIELRFVHTMLIVDHTAYHVSETQEIDYIY